MAYRACAAWALFSGWPDTVWADDAEEAGLALADDTPVMRVERTHYQFSLEPGLRFATERPGDGVRAATRLSSDFSIRRSLLDGWDIAVADRLDLNGPGRLSGDAGAINTLKEWYVSGKLGRDGQTLVDIGRVNVRLGVATGFNPTDYLRDGAVRSITSVDPASLRENRLGTVMLRGQRLWSGGSLSAMYAPRVAQGPSDAAYSPDFGATNARNRWMLSVSQRLFADLSPQWLLYDDGERGSSPQFGVNLTHLLNEACVGYLEWSGGRAPSTLARALGRAASDVAFRWKLATGMTCTTARNLSLTLEYDRDGAALDRAGWRALRANPAAGLLAYRTTAAMRQDLVTRDAVFTMLRWQDAGVPHLDLSAFLRLNLADSSRLSWVEARYHFTRTDVALQWQRQSGSGLSEFGALAQSQLWQLLVKHYF
ncbi:hypothetical protein G3N92_03390 [Burkholderia sp. Ac-20379]|nr:hypothetical protein [Burkholderia sp. Ac-20379]